MRAKNKILGIKAEKAVPATKPVNRLTDEYVWKVCKDGNKPCLVGGSMVSGFMNRSASAAAAAGDVHIVCGEYTIDFVGKN